VPGTHCFSYPADVPPDASSRTPGARARPGRRPGLPAGAYLSCPVWPCFNYPAAIPDRDAGQAARRDLRRMPFPCYSYPSMCFGYPDGTPLGGGNPGPAQPPLSGMNILIAVNDHRLDDPRRDLSGEATPFVRYAVFIGLAHWSFSSCPRGPLTLFENLGFLWKT
jgi:hypothetical protein